MEEAHQPVFDGIIRNGVDKDGKIPFLVQTQNAPPSKNEFICNAALAMYQAINFDQSPNMEKNAKLAVDRAEVLYKYLKKKEYFD